MIAQTKKHEKIILLAQDVAKYDTDKQPTTTLTILIRLPTACGTKAGITLFPRLIANSVKEQHTGFRGAKIVIKWGDKSIASRIIGDDLSKDTCLLIPTTELAIIVLKFVMSVRFVDE
ncbi:hypothetical protein CBL_02272 [Carabus blaptoides fortunei]